MMNLICSALFGFFAASYSSLAMALLALRKPKKVQERRYGRNESGKPTYLLGDKSIFSRDKILLNNLRVHSYNLVKAAMYIYLILRPWYRPESPAGDISPTYTYAYAYAIEFH